MQTSILPCSLVTSSLTTENEFNILQKHNSNVIFSFAIGMANENSPPKVVATLTAGKLSCFLHGGGSGGRERPQAQVEDGSVHIGINTVTLN